MERSVLYKVKTGSHLYGLSTPQSDTDFTSVIMPLPRDILGLQPLEEVDNSTKSSSEDRRNTAEDIDDKQFTLPRYLHLVLGANPEKTEMLFAEPKNVELISPEVQFLIDNRKKLVSMRAMKSFSGFAHSQKTKLIVKKERFTSLCETVDWLEKTISSDRLTDPAETLSEMESITLNSLLRFYKGSKGNCESFHGGLPLAMAYEKIKSERDLYGWRVRTETFETLGYDIKFGYHLVRLLDECRQLLETGEIAYPFTGKAYEDIMSIRRGEVSYKELMLMYESYETAVDSSMNKSVLPSKPDFNFANDWLVETLLNNFTADRRKA